MSNLAQMVAVALAGPLVGVEFGVAAVTNPLAAALPDGSFRAVRGGGSRRLGAVMPFWYGGTLVALVVAAVVSPDAPDAFLIAATLLMGLVLALTVTVLVPINNRIAAWQDDADVSRELATRWDRLHWARVVLLVLMFLLLVSAG